jgi:hypothetical protein
MNRRLLPYLIAVQCLTFSLFGADKVRTIATPNGGSPQHAVTSADGAIHLLYEKDNEPYYVKSTDGGATFSAPLALVDQASKKPGLEFGVWDMALGKDGQILAVLGNNAWKLKLPKDQWGLFLTTLEPGAKAFTPLRNINHEPSEGFSIAADAKGNVALLWLKGKVFCALSRDGGKTFTPGAELNPSYNPCPCCTTAATYGNDGKLAVLYREQTNDERDIQMVLVAADGRQVRQKASTTPFKVNSCPMSYYNVSPTKDGFAAAWPTKGEVYFSRFSADGKILPPGEIKTAGRSGMRTGIITLTNPSGETLVAWNGDNKLGWQVIDPTGAAGRSGNSETRGKGIAAVMDKEGSFIVFQ